MVSVGHIKEHATTMIGVRSGQKPPNEITPSLKREARRYAEDEAFAVAAAFIDGADAAAYHKTAAAKAVADKRKASTTSKTGTKRRSSDANSNGSDSTLNKSKLVGKKIIHMMKQNKIKEISKVSTAQKVTKEAWMCSLCAAIFSSLSSAESHEKICVFEAFEKDAFLAGLRWDKRCRKCIDVVENPTPDDPGLAAEGISDVTTKPPNNNTLLSFFGKKEIREESHHSSGTTASPVRPRQLIFRLSDALSPRMQEKITYHNSEPVIYERTPPPFPIAENSPYSVSGATVHSTNGSGHSHLSSVSEHTPQYTSTPRTQALTLVDETNATPSHITIPNTSTNNKKAGTTPILKSETGHKNCGGNNRKERDTSGKTLSTFKKKGKGQHLHIAERVFDRVVMTDDAVRKVVDLAATFALSPRERDAERELAFLARDRAYYDYLLINAAIGGHNKRTVTVKKTGLLANVQGKLADAYALIKDENQENTKRDLYTQKEHLASVDIKHDKNTIYVNVVVKNSVHVINNELKRLARLRWEDYDVPGNPSGRGTVSNNTNMSNQFERFRKIAQNQFVQIAGLLLTYDFTPRRIAVQLSNVLYRNLAPELANRGVIVVTEIEYRVGAFFVLAVNVTQIDWIQFIKHTHYEVLARKKQLSELKKMELRKRNSNAAEDSSPRWSWRRLFPALVFPTILEVTAQVIAWLYYVHWIIAIPICRVFYFLFGKRFIDTFILESVTEDVFRYVEKKGMEMSISLKSAQQQAPFMLEVLREQRADELKLKKQREEGVQEDQGVILGPLLGPNIKADQTDVSLPADFTPPESLEFEGIDITLPVGFLRLRRALLSTKSQFVTEAVWRADAKYENIVSGSWSRHVDHIGEATLPSGVDPKEFIGAECQNSYLMPKSAFVKANTAHETVTIHEYTDYCFCVKRCTRTPEVPFGDSFLAWTQIVVIRTGKNTCRMICSTEAEFPNGQPMVARQIKSGMRTGTTEYFTLLSSAIIRYAPVKL